MRKFLSLLMVSLMTVFSLSAKTLYLAPNDNWKTADARFAVYAFSDTENAWTSMTAVTGETGLYQATVDDKYATVIFCRMNPATAENNWDNKWNQTGNETVPADKNLFTVAAGAWDYPASAWSVYTPASTGGGENQSGAITLTFTYFDKADGDGNAKLNTVAGIFDAASQQYVSAVNTGTQVYAGRYYLVGEDTIKSNLKLGSSSAAGELKFTLADSVEVDSIVFRAAMYAATEGGDGFKVNGENFTLSAGKLVFENKVWKPTGYVSTIDIVQNKANKGRFFLTAIIIYPKVAGEQPEQPETPTIPTVTVTGDMTNWESEIPFVLAADSLSASLYNDNIKAGTYEFKMKIGGDWRSNGYTYHRGFTGAAGITGNNDANMVFTADVEGAYTFTWTFANDSLGVEYPELPVIIPAKYYITGDSALMDTLAWHPDALKAEQDTMELNLAAGDYTLKVTVDGTWSTGKGYSDLTVKADGLSTDKDNNIHFTLAEAGTVKVIYTNELFKLEGNFYVAPVAKFWVAGGEDIVGEGHGTWSKESALVSYSDTLTLSLAAGSHEFKLITENDEWWGVEHLTDTAAGIYTNEYTNVCFKLTEAGDVKVIYKAGEVFKVEGNFYVAPEAKYYILGDSALVVNAGLTADKAWTPDAIVATNDTLVLNLAAGDYTMRLSLYGGWDNNKGYESLTDTTAGLREFVDEYQNHNIIFTLAEAGAVTVIYNANEFKILGNFYVAPVAKFRIVGDGEQFGNWNPENGMVSYKDTLVMHLAAGNYKFKVVVGDNWYGFTALTDTAAGLQELDAEKNIGFELKEAADVTVVYNDSVFTVSGSFYVEPAPVIVTKDLALVPGVWATDSAVLAAWTWGAEAEGAWSAFEGAGDTLIAKINEKADSVVFVRFEKNAAIDWASNVWNRQQEKIDSCGIFFVNGWDSYSWCEAPAPVIPAKYYITGDSALVDTLAWHPDAIKAEQDTMVLALAAGDYKLKVTVDGDWATGKGYSDLTVKAEGLRADNDNNIVFTLAEAGNVTVVYNDSVFTVSGAFYVEPAPVIVTKDLALVPGVWATDSAVLAAWTWGAEAEGAWSAFEGAGDTLIAKINEKADSVVFVRFEKNAAIDWASNVWNRQQEKIDSCGIFFVNGWDSYSWCEAPAPVIPAKYYITGDSALVDTLAWHPDAIKAEQDTMVLALAAGDYKLKVTVDGDWATGKGYSDLTVKAEGLRADNDNNIVFTLAEAGNVTVVYNDSVFTVSGSFYVEPAPVIVTKDLALVPGVWATDSAVLAAWTWGAEAEGAWSAFEGAGDTLIAKINEKADSVVFVRFEKNAAIDWASNVWNRQQEKIDSCGIFFVNGWDNYSWCEAPAPVIPAKYYITGDSALVDTLAWHPDAIKAEQDTMVLALAAGDYKLKVTIDGDWATGKGYSDLTVKAEGLSADNDNNIVFTLAEAGNVTVVYNDSVFTVSGSFYVAPAPDPTAAVIGTMTEWQKAIPFVLAEDKLSATFADTIPAGSYEVKMIINGEWRSNGGTIDREHPTAIVAGNVDANMTFVADTKGLYTFTWFFANDSFSVVYPEYVEPETPDTTWYLVGDMTNWQEGKISFENGPIVANLTDEGRTYGFKVLQVIGDQTNWYGNAGTMTRENHENWVFETTIQANGMLIADVAGEYTFAMTLNEAGNPVVTVTYPEAPIIVPILEDGYYLVGTMNEWTPAVEYKLAANTETEGEYFVAMTFAENDEFKVVAVANDAITTWYPENADNYVVDGNHTGNTTLYFRPDYQGGEGWYANCLFVVPTSAVGVENVNASTSVQKVLREGQVVIIRGEHIYTPMGQMIK